MSISNSVSVSSSLISNDDLVGTLMNKEKEIQRIRYMNIPLPADIDNWTVSDSKGMPVDAFDDTSNKIAIYPNNIPSINNGQSCFTLFGDPGDTMWYYDDDPHTRQKAYRVFQALRERFLANHIPAFIIMVWAHDQEGHVEIKIDPDNEYTDQDKEFALWIYTCSDKLVESIFY